MLKKAESREKNKQGLESSQIQLQEMLLKNGPIITDEEEFCLDILSILSDKNRKKILYILRDDSKCVKEIQMDLDISQSTLSNHLKVLLNYGIIKVKTMGRKRYYRISEPAIFNVFESLDSNLLKSLEKNIRYNRLKQAIRQYDIESLIQSK